MGMGPMKGTLIATQIYSGTVISKVPKINSLPCKLN